MKMIKSIALSLMIVATLFNSRPSQAAVGAIFAGPAVVTIGLYAMAGGTVTSGLSFVACTSGLDQSGGHHFGCGNSILAGLLGVLAVGVGIVMLDGEQSVSFSPLSIEQAKELKITKAQRLTFNSEIDQVNALASHVDQELAKIASPSVDDSVAAWTEVKDGVSLDTLVVMQKISTKLYE